MKAVILTENTAPGHLEGEHGLSVYIEHRGRRILPDELGVGAIYTGHCTGGPAFALLKKVGQGRVRALDTGTVIEI